MPSVESNRVYSCRRVASVFPQNPCTSCAFVGLCLEQRELVATTLLRKPGVDLGLFDELTYQESADAT